MKFRDRPEEGRKRFMALVEEMSGDSDRAVAIVGAAWVEEALSDAIRSYLQPHEKSQERLFNSNGPLSTFSAKIDLARLLGMVTDTIRADLHTIRDIRNVFAHHIAHQADHTRLTFTSDLIKDRCLALKCIAHERVPEPRLAFSRACATLNSDFDMFTMMAGKVSETFQVFAQGVDEV